MTCAIFSLKGSIALKRFIGIPIKRNASSYYTFECNFSKSVERVPFSYNDGNTSNVQAIKNNYLNSFVVIKILIF